jgi:putative hydrolase of HD superfamily
LKRKKHQKALFAGSIDRLQPMLSNCLNQGTTWNEHGVKRKQVFDKNKVIDKGSKLLWKYAQDSLNQMVIQGILKD